tara:strand:- start:42 stop:200 length:159 start_codon:yes stop_codon:yes gene_type:complete
MMQGTLNNTIFDRSDIQRVLTVRANRFDKKVMVALARLIADKDPERKALYGF